MCKFLYKDIRISDENPAFGVLRFFCSDFLIIIFLPLILKIIYLIESLLAGSGFQVKSLKI